MKRKFLITSALLFSSIITFGQWSGTDPEILSGSAAMGGNLKIGPSGAGVALPGAPPIITIPERKLNIYRDFGGGGVYPSGTPLSSFTTGLKIVHKVGAYDGTPAQHYNWEIASDDKRMYFHDGNSNTTLMALTSTGRMGIGTLGPDATLQIKNLNGTGLDAHLEGFTLIDGNQASLLLGAETTAPYGEWGIEYNEGAGGLNFWKPSGATTGGGNYHLFIKNNGNVGIGTADPKGYQLAVNGRMIAEEVVVKLYSNWPDYVFTKNYGLMSLKEVENYIDENSHLPNVPSAAEIEEEGINLGEMDAILLQKIEELTLYVIQLEKKSQAQAELINKINNVQTNER